MYANAELKVAECPDALVLPKTAVTVADGRSVYLTIDAEGIIAARPIETGIRTDERSRDRLGTIRGEQVIAVNVSRAGQKVGIAESK